MPRFSVDYTNNNLHISVFPFGWLRWGVDAYESVGTALVYVFAATAPRPADQRLGRIAKRLLESENLPTPLEPIWADGAIPREEFALNDNSQRDAGERSAPYSTAPGLPIDFGWAANTTHRLAQPNRPSPERCTYYPSLIFHTSSCEHFHTERACSAYVISHIFRQVVKVAATPHSTDEG